MIIKSADFICSNTQISRLPIPIKPEFAFIGRSNVGKSSLINMLVQKKGLQKHRKRRVKRSSLTIFW
jgi:GTP-binding protein